MIRTLIKLAIVALALNAIYHIGDVYWAHYQFEDSVQQLAQFAENTPPEDVRAKVMELAAAQDIPIDPSDLSVTRAPRHIEVNAVYTRDVPLFPRYSRPWEFKVHVVVITLN